jgi:hypothetical protein
VTGTPPISTMPESTRPPGGDGDQRRLTRAVLSDQRVDLSFGDLEADALESDHARERLDDVRQPENDASRRQ